MKNEKNLGGKVMGCVNVLAMHLVKQTANATCMWVAYQPKFPEEAQKFVRK